MFCRHKLVTVGKELKWLVVVFLSITILIAGQPYLARGQAKTRAGESHLTYGEGAVGKTARRELDKEKEEGLRKALNELRQAINEYKIVCDQGLVGPIDRKKDDKCYPPTLQTLVDGIQPPSTKYYIVFLRRIPVDPMTGEQDWVLRSIQDEKDAETWGGQNVFNVYSKSDGVAADGTKYRDW